MNVFIFVINSNYYDDKIPRIVGASMNEDVANDWKKATEENAAKYKDIELPELKGLGDYELDRYNEIKKAKEFLSAEILTFPILREWPTK